MKGGPVRLFSKKVLGDGFGVAAEVVSFAA